jgi:WD40 repeat protein
VISSLPPNVVDVALSPAGLVASSHSLKVVSLLRLADRRIEHLEGGSYSPGAVAFSPDGRTVAAACEYKGTKQTRLWEAASGSHLLTLNHGARVNAVAFSPTGEIVATASADGIARLWELPSREPRTTCAAGPGSANCLAFAADGRTLAVGSTGHSVTVSLWDPLTGERRGGLTDPGSMSSHHRTPANTPPADEPSLSVAAVAFSPDGTSLAAACSDGVIRLWDVASGDLRHTFSGHVGAVRRLAFAPDGRTLASLGDDRAINLWHLGTGQRLFSLDNPRPRHVLGSLAFSRDGRLLVAGGSVPGDTGPSSLLLWRAEPAGP